MAAKAILMEQLKQILRLKHDGLSIKAIVRHTGTSRPTIRKYLARIRDAVVDKNNLTGINSKCYLMQPSIMMRPGSGVNVILFYWSILFTQKQN